MAIILPETVEQFVDEKFKNFRERFVPRSEAVEGAIRIVENIGEQPTKEELLDLVKKLAVEFKATELKTYIDTTSGGFNKTAFDAAISHIANENYTDAAFPGQEEHIKPTAIVFLDLNYLKQINDISYANGGNKAIRYLSEYITKRIPEGDLFARVGGDEFGIIMKNSTKEQAETKIRKILEDMAKDSLDPDKGCICKDDHTKVSVPVQISAAIGCADLLTKLPEGEVSLNREQDVEKIIHLSVGAAQQAQAIDKILSKEYAANVKDSNGNPIEGAMPAADKRLEANEIVGPFLRKRFGHPEPAHAPSPVDSIQVAAPAPQVSPDINLGNGPA